jgi:hypothetical protein
MDIGSGIAIGSAILGAVAVIFKIFPANGNGSKSLHNQCNQHAAIVAKFDDMSSWLEKIEKKLDRLIDRRSEVRE